MPWCETTPMRERLEFLRDHQRGLSSFAALCRHYEISRKTGYKWLTRFGEEGLSGLADSLPSSTHPCASGGSVPRRCVARDSTASSLVGAEKDRGVPPRPQQRPEVARGEHRRRDSPSPRPHASSTPMLSPWASRRAALRHGLPTPCGPQTSKVTSKPAMAVTATRSPSSTASAATCSLAKP